MKDFVHYRYEVRIRVIVYAILTSVIYISLFMILYFKLNVNFSEVTEDPMKILGLVLFVLSDISISYAVAEKFTRKERLEYKKYYVDTVVLPKLESVFNNVEYSLRGYDVRKIKTLNLIGQGHDIKSHDNIKGEYEGVSFEKVGVILEFNTTNSEGNPAKRTVFQGDYYILNLKNKEGYNFAVLDKTLNQKQIKKYDFVADGYKKQKIDNWEFDNKYTLYNLNEELDVKVYLNEKFLTKLKKMNVEKGFGFLVLEDEIHIAIEGRYHSFEPHIFKRDHKDMDQTIDKQIKQIQDVIKLFI